MNRYCFIMIIATFSLILVNSEASAQPPMIDTEKTMYNLDPYYWVYSASLYEFQGVNPNLWPMDGHDVNVRFSLSGYSGSSPLTFTVQGLTEPVEGDVTEDPQEPGVFKGDFFVDEVRVGGDLFKPGEKDPQGNLLVPMAVTLTISDANGTVASRQIKIDRWGCDRCHLSRDESMEVYSWSSPSGGPRGPHSWPNVLGRNGGRSGFTYEHLTDASLTHTPINGGYVTDRQTGAQVWTPNPLDRNPYHQQTIRKLHIVQCSPCHNGSGHVRSPYTVEGTAPGMLSIVRERSTAVKCVFCHGMSGGYVPEEPKPLWENWLLEGWN